MTNLVAIGECMVEMTPSGSPGDFQMGFAGDTMNTAWYLRKLLPAGDRIDYLTAVGTDAVSDQMVDFLNAAGIGTNLVQRRSDRTVGLYMIQLQNGERSFSYWRGQSAARTLAQNASVLRNALVGADFAYFSGITLAILPVPDRIRLLETLTQYRSGGGQIAFDPNLRPNLWASTKEMVNFTMQAAAISDIVLPSFEDEAKWFGDADIEATASRYAGVGANHVVVKNGAGRIFACLGEETCCHDPVPVAHIMDTTAAGDSFNAGYLASWLGGHSLTRSVIAGSELAARIVQARGALVGDFR